MKSKTDILLFLIIVLTGGYLFIRALPTIFINQPIKCTYIAAIKVQDFAKKHNHLFFHKRYKAEIEKYIASAVPKAEKELDEIVSEAQKYSEEYKKNPNKENLKHEYQNKLYDYERGMESPEFWLYVRLSEIQDKYLLIPIGGLPTDWVGAYADILLPYFDKYNVDYRGLERLGKYYSKKLKELRELQDI